MDENAPEMPSLVEDSPRRIVFQHTQGKHPGLHAIMGLTSDFGLKGRALPEAAEMFEAQGRVIPFAGLVKATSRYALYREPALDQPSKFDRRQV